MLYLRTGANGTCKTLFTLKDVMEMSVKEGRPVVHNGRFKVRADGPIANWRVIDAKDWQKEPDATIFLFDEAHNDFPVRPNGSPVPEHVRMLAEHRARGFDFFFLTQHPNNLDAFIRRLIGNPGWHQHLKRLAGSSLVSVCQWDAVNGQCEKPGSGNSGQVTTRAQPREVFQWYDSATLHTAKFKIPRPVLVLGACAVLVPLAAFFGYRAIKGNQADLKARMEAKNPAVAGRIGGVQGVGASEAERHVLTAAEYAAAKMPRFAGLPFTAAAYDEVTKPTVAPYPAACVFHQKTGQCDCYTQQATRLETPMAVCKQIAFGGIFVDWRQEVASAPVRESASVARAPASVAPVAVAPAIPAGAPGAPGPASSGPALLSAPGDTVPKVFPALESRLVGEPSAQELRDAAVMLSMRDGQWSKR